MNKNRCFLGMNPKSKPLPRKRSKFDGKRQFSSAIERFNYHQIQVFAMETAYQRSDNKKRNAPKRVPENTR